MNTFIKTPASKKSIAFRKLVHGVGTNDATYNVTFASKNGKINCPYYEKWIAMLRRCYSGKFLVTHPSYIGCSVTDEWLLFSNFRQWMVGKCWEGSELDKDLLIQGNRVYSPKSCVFISRELNLLLTNKERGRGKYPQGVDLSKGRYRARCNYGGASVYLGCFDTPEQAHRVYKEFKYSVIRRVAMSQPEPLRSSLLAYKINYLVV